MKLGQGRRKIIDHTSHLGLETGCVVADKPLVMRQLSDVSYFGQGRIVADECGQKCCALSCARKVQRVARRANAQAAWLISKPFCRRGLAADLNPRQIRGACVSCEMHLPHFAACKSNVLGAMVAQPDHGLASCDVKIMVGGDEVKLDVFGGNLSDLRAQPLCHPRYG